MRPENDSEGERGRDGYGTRDDKMQMVTGKTT